jgi:hypothetical protein
MYLKTWLSSNKKIVAFIVLAIVCLSVLFVFSNQKLTQYSCKNSVNTEACFECEVSKYGEKVDFLVNKNNQTVMKRTFVKVRGELVIQPILYEKCKIFDAKNWDCSESFRLPNGYSHKTHAVMVDNIFSSYTQSSADNKESFYGWCAK